MILASGIMSLGKYTFPKIPEFLENAPEELLKQPLKKFQIARPAL
jgi:hypothetical protein